MHIARSRVIPLCSRRCFSACFLLITVILALGGRSWAVDARLEWDPRPESYVTGYRLYYGNSSGDYVNSVDVGNGSSFTVASLDNNQTYYFAVTSYAEDGRESDYSNELVGQTIVVSAGANGSVSPGTIMITRGQSQTFTVTPSADCHVVDVSVDGVSIGAVTAYTLLNVTENHTIQATFAPDVPDVHSITASASEYGSISPSGSVEVSHGGAATFTISADSGCHIKDVVVDGGSIGAVSSHTFSNVTADHSITAFFEINSYMISALAGQHGSISPSGDVAVEHGSSASFTITPDDRYHVKDVEVDGASIGAVDTYTFSNVTSNHSISATFELNSHKIKATGGQHGSISPEGEVVVTDGDSMTFTMEPDTGYRVADVLVDGDSVGAENTYSFSEVVEDHEIEAVFEPDSEMPSANAGPEQRVSGGDEVSLTGLNSFDLDEGIESYHWQQVSGPSVLLSDPNAAVCSFTAPDVGTDGASLIFELTIVDGAGLEATDICIINVIRDNTPPTAEAGPEQRVSDAETVTLDGSGSNDPEGNIAGYLWEQLSGSEVILSDPYVAKPVFVAPTVGSAGEALVFRLTVTDGGGLQSMDQCIVNVTWANQPPVAALGSADGRAETGSTVTLDASGSTDPDDGIAGYRWRQTHGVPVTLSDPTAVRPSFMVPDDATGSSLVFDLTVTDTGGLQSHTTCSIDVQAASGMTIDIKANGDDGPVALSQGTQSTNVLVTVSADPGEFLGRQGEFWVLIYTGRYWLSFVNPGKLQFGIKPYAQSPLQPMDDVTILNRALPPGPYLFIAAYDTTVDGIPKPAALDAVLVTVAPAE